MPAKPVPSAFLKSLLADAVKHPLEEWEADGALNPGDPHQNPELALSLNPNGVPTWWPLRHPRTQSKLSPAQRRRWFLDWLSGELSPKQATLLSGARSYRRRILAQSLLLTHAEGGIAEIPTPDPL